MLCGIGMICELTGLTPRAVRYYEDRGLVEPVRTRMNARQFDQSARARLMLIADLRRVGLSLRDIEAILELDDCPAKQREMVERRLDARSRTLAKLLAETQRMMAQFEVYASLNSSKLDGAKSVQLQRAG